MFGKRILWAALLFLAIGVFGLITFFFYLENKKLKTQIEIQSTQLIEQRNSVIASQNAGLMVLMENILQQVDKELKENSTRKLSSETISRIAAISHVFKPYQIGKDSLLCKALSPERGQLLLTLALKKMNISSWHTILDKTTFESADLRKVDLQKKDFQRARLKGACFKNGNFSGSNFKNADLRDSDFWGAKLNHSIFTKSNLTRANMAWADLNYSRIDSALVLGAKVNNSKLRNANLNYTKLKRSNMGGVILKKGTMKGANLWGCNLTRSNLEGTNMNEVTLASSEIQEANFTNVKMEGLILKNEFWIKDLPNKRVIGTDRIKDIYEIEKLPNGLFRLKLKS